MVSSFSPSLPNWSAYRSDASFLMGLSLFRVDSDIHNDRWQSGVRHFAPVSDRFLRASAIQINDLGQPFGLSL